MIHHLFWPKLTEADHASDQAGAHDQGPTSTVEAVEKWVSPDVKLRLYQQAGDPFLPTEQEVERVVCELEGRVNMTEIILFLRAGNIARRHYMAESRRWASGQ